MKDKPKSSILVVDDDATILKTLSAILEAEGYLVDTADTGAKAVKKSNEKSFDLALIDMRLPDMPGTQVLGALRVRVPKTAKIIVTGYPTLQNAIKAVNEDADGYILKPVDPQKLLIEIGKHLALREDSRKYSEDKVAEFIVDRAQLAGMSPEEIRELTKGDDDK